MSAAAGPGPIPMPLADALGDLPEGWEAFATNDGDRYFSFPRVYYYCRKRDHVQWEQPGPSDEVEDEFNGATINGKKPYESGDEIIPEPPAEPTFAGPYSDDLYKPSLEDQGDEAYAPDEEMLDACLECDVAKLKKAIDDGADVSLPNEPWMNTPLHLACMPYHWDAETVEKEKELRFELARVLVSKGADLDVANAFGCTPLDFAVFHDYPLIASFLEEKGASFSLMGSAYAGRLDKVKELLKSGADIDQEGRYGRTAFAEAHLRGEWRVEQFLAEQGCFKGIPHSEHLKFNPGGAALPKGAMQPRRERQYHREDDPMWYDDMMEKRFPGYAAKMAKVPKDAL